MIKVEINNVEFLIKPSISILEACEYVGIDVPRFCYHQSLSVAGNCRMCLVEISNSPKPVASCALPVLNNMKIFVDSPLVKKARENVLEALLLNHPLDCPICDQGGECDLQDQSKIYGSDRSRFFFKKRAVEDKNCNLLIKTIMTRCIHCTRCVRFNSEISGNEFLGTINRGVNTEIGSYLESTYNSEISANVIDLCPVGALTSKPYAFKARPWELKTIESIDLSDGLGSNIYVSSKETEIMRVFPKINYEINGNLISDRARFYFDFNKINRLKSSTVDIKLFWSFLKKDYNKVLFLTNAYNDFDTLSFCKNLDNVIIKENVDSAEKVSFLTKNLNFNSLTSNFNISWLNNSVLDVEMPSKMCFLLSSNIRLENSIINTKLRIKQTQNEFSLFGFLSNFSSNLNINFLNLNAFKVYRILEAKNQQLSNLLLNYKNPLIIYNDNIFKRGLNNFFFNEFIKNIIPTAILVKVQEQSNLESMFFLNSFSTSSKDLENVDFIFAIDLDESSFYLKRFLNKKQKTTKVFWFNTHLSETVKNENFFSFPITTEYEEEKIFMNMEQRLQKTSKIFNPVNKAIVSIKKHLGSLFNFKKNPILIDDQNFQIYNNSLSSFFYFKQYKFLKELLKKKTLFYTLNFSKYYSSKILEKFTNKNKFIISSYPAKTQVEDFYMSNKSLKNSKIMQKCSQDFRKNFKNF